MRFKKIVLYVFFCSIGHDGILRAELLSDHRKKFVVPSVISFTEKINQGASTVAQQQEEKPTASVVEKAEEQKIELSESCADIEPVVISEPEEKVETPQRFILMMMLYNEKNEKRIKEYMYCFEKNMAHALIDTIHIFYDTADDDKKDSKKNSMYVYLKKQQKVHPSIVIEHVHGRVAYTYCFEKAKELYKDCAIVLSNADIYYDKTLNLLEHYDLSHLFLTITRHDVYKDGSASLPYMYTSQRPRLVPKIHPITAFHDTWIFKSPLAKFKDTSILMGTAYCDWRIAYEAHAAGLTVINPCLSIHCYHVHMSAVRNYDAHAIPRPSSSKIYETPWCILPFQE
ncbi:MAG TPA: hypothetical protein VEK38_01295 [Candidatus Bathyarchaeia archaeon]|nr:hypothetical protein [Candidatus Bathyarchaeia archaeon]